MIHRPLWRKPSQVPVRRAWRCWRSLFHDPFLRFWNTQSFFWPTFEPPWEAASSVVSFLADAVEEAKATFSQARSVFLLRLARNKARAKLLHIDH